MNQYPETGVFTGQDAQVRQLQISKLLRNTYMLLGMTLAFSAVAAYAGMVLGMPYLGLLTLLPYFGLLFAVEKFKNSSLGIVFVFALTGWLGLTLSPIISAYIGFGAADTITLALGGTAAIFFCTSGYVLVTKRNMKFMEGFLMTGILVAFIAGIANYFLNITGLGLAVSCMFLLLSSGLIMWQTSEIIHGGETNYISATVTLYVSIYNIFVSLLSLIGMGND